MEFAVRSAGFTWANLWQYLITQVSYNNSFSYKKKKKTKKLAMVDKEGIYDMWKEKHKDKSEIFYKLLKIAPFATLPYYWYRKIKKYTVFII